MKNEDYYFQKFLLSDKYIKQLRFYIGELESEREELKDQVKKLLSFNDEELKQKKIKKIESKHKREINKLNRNFSKIKKQRDNLLYKEVGKGVNCGG